MKKKEKDKVKGVHIIFIPGGGVSVIGKVEESGQVNPKPKNRKNGYGVAD